MKQILVVDNHPVMRRFMTRYLVKRGYEVLTAPDGLSAFELLKTCIPDIIFIDLVMPNISGDKLCRMIRCRPQFNRTRLIILSAVAAEQENVDFASFGADACIAKGPVDVMSGQIAAVLDSIDSATCCRLSPGIQKTGHLHPREITRELLASLIHSNVILNNMSEGILELSTDNRIVFVNPKAVDLLGIPEEDILSLMLVQFFHKTHQDRIDTLLKTVDTKQMPQTIGLLKPLSLNHRLVCLQVIPFRLEDRTGKVVFLKDVTVQKQAELELRQSEAKYRMLVEQMSEIIFTTDKSGVIMYVNPAVETAVGYPPLELIGRRIHEFVYEEDMANFHPVIQTFRSGENGEVECRAITSTGKIRWFRTRCRPVFLEQKLVAIQGIASDVTEKKTTEERWIRSQRLAASGQLAASIAHEINSPLQGITALLNIIRRKDFEQEELVKITDLLDGAFRSIRDTVKNLLDLNHPGKGKKQLTDINAVIKTTIAFLKTELECHDVHIFLDLLDDLPVIHASPQQLSNVFNSLIHNSMEAMTGRLINTESPASHLSRQNGITVSRTREIHIHSRLQSDCVVLELTDTGPGIPVEDLHRIFDPFYTHKKQMGIGIGLSVCHQIIEEHGGSISAGNIPQKGAVFTIQLPVFRK